MNITQRIHRIWSAVECERVMSGHVFFHAAANHREELEQLWTKGECTWAHCFGQMADRATFFNAYVEGQESAARGYFEQAAEAYPEILEEKNLTDIRTIAEVPIHYITNQVLEVAEDGQTARAIYYTPGIVWSTLNAEKKKECMWMYERYGVDFVFENGRWVFHHMKICADIEHAMEFPEWPLLPLPESETDANCDTGGNFLEGPMSYYLTPTMLPQRIPYLPVPYRHYSELKSYSVPFGGKYDHE